MKVLEILETNSQVFRCRVEIELIDTDTNKSTFKVMEVSVPKRYESELDAIMLSQTLH